MTGGKRGRPPGAMTMRRKQVLALYQDAAERGERISLSRMARETGLFDYRKARRVLNDLRRIGALS
jgi:hypothetical protein